MMKRNCVIVLILQIIIVIVSGGRANELNHSPSISHVTALLPFNPPLMPESPIEKPVRFKLEASGGCFSWHASQNEVLSLNDIVDKKCSTGTTAVWITPTDIPHTDRYSVWVWAEETSSGERLECEVFIDHVHRLEVLTSTRVVNVGDAESIDLQAFDKQNNVFSTLAGLPFEWTNSNPLALQNLHFSEAGIDIREVYHTLEKLGLFSDKFPIKGSRTGKTEISAQLIAPFVNKVSSVSVVFSVVEPLYLAPSSIAVAPATDFNLQLETRFRDSSLRAVTQRRRLISMPSDQYTWSSTKPGLVVVDALGQCTGIAAGRARVFVQDNNFLLHEKQSDIRIVTPSRLLATVSDVAQQNLAIQSSESVWQLIRGRRYAIDVNLRSDEGLQMSLGVNVLFSMFIDGDVIEVEKTSDSRAKFYMTAGQQGPGSVTLTLKPIISERMMLRFEPATSISVCVHLFVLDPVDFVDTHIMLPWTGIAASLHAPQHSLRAIGGSGKYHWLSSAASTVSVAAQTGVVTAVSVGQSVITAIDVSNALNFAELTVFVTMPNTLELLTSSSTAVTAVEFDVDDELTLYFGVGQWTNCNNLNAMFTLNVDDDDDDDEKYSIVRRSQCQIHCAIDATQSCFEVVVTSSRAGFATLTSTLNVSNQVAAAVRIACYDKLVLQPSNAVMASGTTIAFKWFGGPLAWHVDDGINARVVTETDKVVSVHTPNALWQERSFNITCHDVHTQNITVLLVNPVSAENASPTHSSSSALLRCFPPLQLSSRHLDVPLATTHRLTLRHPHALSPHLLYTSDNPSIASVDRYGNIVGNYLGRTVIRVSAASALFDHIDVRVAFRGFVIVGALDTLLLGNTMLLQVHGIDGEMPDHASFKHVRCSWFVQAGSTNVVMGQPLFDMHSLHTNSSMHITGNHVGAVVVQVRVHVQDDARVFHAERRVQVLPPLTLTSAYALLLPPRASSNIETSLDHVADTQLTYTVDSLLSVTERGVVRVGDDVGDAVVFVNVMSERFEQSASVLVSVRNIAGIGVRLRRDHDVYHNNVDAICVGFNRTLDVHLHDSLGRTFDGVDDADLSFRSANTDVLRIHRSSSVVPKKSAIASLELQGVLEGTSVLKLWLRDTSVPPVFINIAVLLSAACRPMQVSRISLPFRFDDVVLPRGVTERQSWVTQLITDLSTATDVSAKLFSVVSVNACKNLLLLDTLPIDDDAVPSSSRIIKQATNPSSLLLQGVLTKHIDTVRSSNATAVHMTNLSTNGVTEWITFCASPSSSSSSSSSSLDLYERSQLLTPFAKSSNTIITLVLVAILTILLYVASSYVPASPRKSKIVAVGGPLKPIATHGVHAGVNSPRAFAGPGLLSPFERRARQYRRESETEPMRAFGAS